MMSPQALLAHHDAASLWPPAARAADAPGDLAAAYRTALALRELRIARGERPRGFKIGFTNRSIWPRYNVFAPIWGTVWRETLEFCDEGRAEVSLDGICQPRLEPECVFGVSATPAAGATLEQLFDCLDWFAPGIEIVQSHCPDWKFDAAESVADGGLHARLLVGARKAVRAAAAGDALAFDATLARTPVTLRCDGRRVDGGTGANVLDGPLRALHHFLLELQRCPGAPAFQPGDVVTTGTWTDAWPVAAGQVWQAGFGAPLAPIEVAMA